MYRAQIRDYNSEMSAVSKRRKEIQNALKNASGADKDALDKEAATIELTYKSVIRQTVLVSESISAQQGVVLFAPNSTAAQDYRAFAREIKREELMKGGIEYGNEESGLPAKHRRNVPDLER